MYPEGEKQVAEVINTLADRLNREIKQGKPGHYLPGDEGKMSKADVLRKTDLSKRALNAILEGYEPNPEKKGIKTLPSVETLMKLCNVLDCELDYLLGFQEHKKKVIGSVTSITGLSEEVVEVLGDEVEFKRTHMELGFDDEELGADRFLEYLILNHPKTKLLQRIRHEDAYTQLTREYRRNSKSYQVAKDAYEEAVRVQMPNNPALRLFFQEEQKDDRLEKTFVAVLAGRLRLNEEEVDKWAKDEFRRDAHYLYQFLELEQTRAERIRVIEDCFTDLVKDYLREGEKDAEK